MSTDERPGGLTALAVVNFILGAWWLLVASLLRATPLLIQTASQSMTDQQRAQIQPLAEIGTHQLLVLFACYLAAASLSIAAGVGYLRLKRFLGRTVGSAGAVYTVAMTIAIELSMGGGFGLLTLLTIFYAALTLFLLNVTFKEDLVN